MTKPTHIALLLVVFAIALCGATPAANAMSIRARVDGVFAVADQLFDGGDIVLSSIGQGNLMAMSVDGRRIALLQPVLRGDRTSDAVPVLVFRRDQRGFLHFAYVLYESAHGPQRQLISFRVTALAAGLVTLPYRFSDEATAVAAR